MTRPDILKATVPDILEAMKATLKAGEDYSLYLDRSRDLVMLIARINAAYPREIVEAAYMIAGIRFHSKGLEVYPELCVGLRSRGLINDSCRR